MLPRGVPVLAIEAGVTNFWRAYTGFDGDVVGIDRFGESAPAAQVAAALGLTREAVCARARALAAARGGRRDAGALAGRRSRPMRCGAVLFDLDGTLLDTAEDIAVALNRALAEQQTAPLTAAGARA